MATFNGVPYAFSDFSAFGYAEIWDAFWSNVLTELSRRAAAIGGSVAAISYGWDAGTADADPGAGKLRVNNATLASATQLYLSNTDSAAAAVGSVADLFDDSTSAIKGLLRVGHQTDPTKWALYLVTGAVAAGAGYRKVPVSYVAGPGGFTATDPVALGFVPKGDKGDQGPAGVMSPIVAQLIF